MSVKRKTISDAGIVLSIFREYKSLPTNHPDKPAFAAALAAVTAESLGSPLHVYGDDDSTPFTLLVSEWTESSSPKAVLLNRSISDWTTAVSFWNITNQNLFRRAEGFEDLKNIDLIILKSTYELWTNTPKGSPVRWAEAAHLYDESCLAALEGLWFDDEGEYKKWNNKLNDLTPKLLEVLGYDSILQIDSTCKDRAFPTQFLKEVLMAPIDQDLTRMAYSCIAKPLPTHIPIEVLSDRGELSPTQALAYYLVDEEYGPKLTYAAAASMLGMKNRQEIGTHLKRARTTLQKSGKDAKLSGVVRSKKLVNEEVPRFRFSLSL